MKGRKDSMLKETKTNIEEHIKLYIFKLLFIKYYYASFI